MKIIFPLGICVLILLGFTPFSSAEKEDKLSFLFTPSVFVEELNKQIDFYS